MTKVRVSALIEESDIPFHRLGYVPEAEVERRDFQINEALRALANGQTQRAIELLALYGRPDLAATADIAVKKRAHEVRLAMTRSAELREARDRFEGAQG